MVAARSTSGTETDTALRVLADLAPDRRRTSLEVTRRGPTALAWIGYDERAATAEDPGDRTGEGPSFKVDSSDHLRRLAAHDALDPGIDDLRIGWLWVSGTATVDGRPQRILQPVVSRSVRIGRLRRQAEIIPTGPWDLWGLVDDEALAGTLESSIQFDGGGFDPASAVHGIRRLPGLWRWMCDVASASGIDEPTLAGDTYPVHPDAGLTAHTGFAVFTEPAGDPFHPSATLAAWARDPAASSTSLAHMYATATSSTPPRSRETGIVCGADVVSPYPLTDQQAQAVVSSRTEAVTVVSGPPGTGKSQTAAAIALDAISSGASVLVATRSATAADVIAGLLARVPGPDPVLFAGRRGAGSLARDLADGLAAPTDRSAERELASVDAEAAEIGAATVAVLEGVEAQRLWDRRAHTVPAHIDAAPLLFGEQAAPDDLLAEVEALLASAAPAPDGWWGRRRARRAGRRLRRLVGAGSRTPIEAVAAAASLARLRSRAHAVGARITWGDADARWSALAQVEARRSAARARAVGARASRSIDDRGRRQVAALAAALRSGRATRRHYLHRVDVRALNAALPLWVGTLDDIEALLPPAAGAFDLVILDEASQIDQVAASSALLRAERAVVVGDPRQLRFVSFTADADVTAAIEANGAAGLADRLDVRRVSAFDLAASAAPVIFLDEHFRSVPHLIGFSARRFYGGRLTVATRRPANESALAIEIRRVDGLRTTDGVNHAEVEAAVAAASDLLLDSARTTLDVGIVSPYRPQVDAIRSRVTDLLPHDLVASGRLRVGTVHGFQGGECGIVIASFGLSDRRGRRFLEDPNLFNVLVTRARHELVVVTSLEDPPPGLLADYIRWATEAPPPQPDEGSGDEWTARLASALADAGVPVRSGYVSGRHMVDLVIGTRDRAVGVFTTVHPEGPRAHIGRHLALSRMGWNLTEAFPLGLDPDPVVTALGLARRLGTPEDA